MIKFFRRIRQKLLSENKFSKYILYAFGEIVLVVIGILIALQINNWNQKQKTDKTELSLLIDLKSELASNISRLERVIKEDELSLSANTKLNAIMNNSDEFARVNDSTFSSLLGRMNITWTFDPELGTLKSIVNSGKIEVLKNDALRHHLASLESNIVDANEATGYLTSLRTSLFFDILRTKLVQEDNGWRYSKNQFNNSEFVFWIRTFKVFKKGAIEEEKILLENFKEIHAILESEILKKNSQ